MSAGSSSSTAGSTVASWKWVFAAFGLAIAVNPAAAQEDKETALRDYMVCVRRVAIRFEPSGESPQSIAEAATWACLSEGVKAMNFLLHDANPGISPTGLVDSANQAAIGQVVGVRLCKNNHDCAYSTVPK